KTVFNDGLVDVTEGAAVDKSVKGRNMILRAKVKKLPGQDVRIALRHDDSTHCYEAWYNGNGSFGVAKCFFREQKVEDVAVQNVPGNLDGRFFEFALAAVEDKLTVYVEGKRVLELRDASIADSGWTGIGANRGQFMDVEVQVLDGLPP